MQEDTPEATPSNSHGPVESNRNEDGDIGVGMDMEPTETPSTDIGETQASDSTPPQNIAAPSADAASETVAESSGEPFGFADPPFVPFPRAAVRIPLSSWPALSWPASSEPF